MQGNRELVPTSSRHLGGNTLDRLPVHFTKTDKINYIFLRVNKNFGVLNILGKIVFIGSLGGGERLVVSRNIKLPPLQPEQNGLNSAPRGGLLASTHSYRKFLVT